MKIKTKKIKRESTLFDHLLENRILEAKSRAVNKLRALEIEITFWRNQVNDYENILKFGE